MCSRIFEPILGSILGPQICIFFVIVWVTFWATSWAIFGVNSGTVLGPDRPKKRLYKMGPPGPSRASQTQKAEFSKNFRNLLFSMIFGFQRPPRRASGGPRRLQRGSQRAPKPQKNNQKMDPKICVCLAIRWVILRPILELKFDPKLNQNWLHFWVRVGADFCDFLNGGGGLEFRYVPLSPYALRVYKSITAGLQRLYSFPLHSSKQQSCSETLLSCV